MSKQTARSGAPAESKKSQPEADEPLRVTEIFYSIQGESTRAGLPCTFIRLARCSLRCTWCDTEYSFHGGEHLSFDQILDRVDDYSCSLVELTGGEPLLQPGAFQLMRLLCDNGYDVMLETSGSRDISDVDDRVKIVMDLKAPGSGMVERNRYDNLEHLKPDDEIKFVILDRKDFEWAIQQVRKRELTDLATVIFSPVHGELDPQKLAQWIMEADAAPIRLGVQLHKYIGME